MRVKSKLKLFAVLVVTLFAIIPAEGAVGTFNERFAAGAIQQLHAAEITFINVYSTDINFGTLQQLANSGLIDPVLATGDKYGYHFSVNVIHYSGTQSASFECRAVPQRYGKFGRQSFYINVTGVSRAADHQGEPATPKDPAFSLCYGNEDLTIGSMRTIGSAESTYFSTYGANINFGGLRNLLYTSLIDQSLGSGARCGYLYTVININAVPATGVPATFRATAVPMEYQTTGSRSFYIDETGVLRAADHAGAPATANDPPLNNLSFIETLVKKKK